MVTGDINLDILKWDNPEKSLEYMVYRIKQEVEARGFKQLIRGPTQFWPGRESTLIDQSWMNKEDRILKVLNIDRGHQTTIWY